MKIKTEKNRREKSEQLVIRTTKGEKLDYAQAEVLKNACNSSVLPFSYEADKQGETRFIYDITALAPLQTYLKAELSLPQFRSMLEDVRASVAWCSAEGLDATRLFFDHQHVYLDTRSNRLCFAYLPAHGLPADRATAMDLLRFIADRASFVCKENDVDAASLLDYLKRQTVFSAIDFKLFLESTAFKKDAVAPAMAFSKTDVAQPRASEASDNGPVEATGARNPFAHASTGEESDAHRPTDPSRQVDFIKAQSGRLSAQEIRSRQSFAEQVAADVAEAGASSDGQPTPAAGGASTGDTAPACRIEKPASASAPLDRQASTPLAPNPPIEVPSPSLRLDGTPDDEVKSRTPSSVDLSPFSLTRTDGNARIDIDPNRQTTLGRSKRCTIRIADNPNVSRVHAVLSVTDGVCFITDQNSLNHTYVSGKALEAFEPTPLERGSTFFLADERLTIV